MRKQFFGLALCVALAASSVAFASDAQLSGLEGLVTCSQGQLAQAEVAAIGRSQGFSQDPKNKNYYVPTGKATAFGFELRYVGLAGVRFQPGPNLTVVASVQELKGRVESALNVSFTCGKIGCWHKLSKQQVILIYPYETNHAFSTIQCGYFGQ